MRAMPRRPGAHELVDQVVDEASFVSWDEPISRDGLDEGYRQALDAAAARAGTDESVITGRARIEGHDVALVVGEFAFLGGSIGQATAERLTVAVERATARRLPLLVSPLLRGPGAWRSGPPLPGPPLPVTL